MTTNLRHRLAVLLRLGVLSALGAAIMVGGIAILLSGAWAGLLLVLSGAVLMAVPAALCVTHVLCERLYGAEPKDRHQDETLDAPELIPAPQSDCSCCQVISAWLAAELRGAHLPIWEVCSMRKRGTPPALIIDAYVMIRRTGIPTTIAALEDLYITERARIHDAFDLVHVVTGIKD